MMIGHVTRESLKSDPGIMLDFCEAGGGCSPADCDSLNAYSSLPLIPTPESKNTKMEFSELTYSECVSEFKKEIFERGVFIKRSDAVKVEKFIDFLMEVKI